MNSLFSENFTEGWISGNVFLSMKIFGRVRGKYRFNLSRIHLFYLLMALLIYQTIPPDR